MVTMPEFDHNIAGAPLHEIAADALTAKLREFEERRAEILSKLPKIAVVDEDTTGRAAAVIKAIRALDDAVCQRGKEVAQPYGDAYDTVSARVSNWLQELRDGLETVNAKIESYRSAERERIRNARIAQQQEEARLRAAANPLGIGEKPRARGGPAPVVEPEEVAIAPLPAVRGDYGTLTTDRAKVDYEIEDVRKLPDEVLNAPAVIKALKSACRSYGRLKPDIPGARKVDGIGSVTRS